MLFDARRKSRLRAVSSSGRSAADQAVNWAVYEARVRELTEAVSTALSTARCAHMIELARASRSLVALACVRCGPWISKVMPI